MGAAQDNGGAAPRLNPNTMRHTIAANFTLLRRDHHNPAKSGTAGLSNSVVRDKNAKMLRSVFACAEEEGVGGGGGGEADPKPSLGHSKQSLDVAQTLKEADLLIGNR